MKPRIIDIDLNKTVQRATGSGLVPFGQQSSLLKDATASPEQVAIELGVARYPAVFRAVRAIYTMIAAGKLRPTRTKSDGSVTWDEGTRPARTAMRLLRRPNAFMSGNDLIEWITLWYNLREALVWMRFPDDAKFNGIRYSKPPTELRVLPSNKVKAKLKDGVLRRWELARKGDNLSIPASEVIRIAMPNPRDDIRGLAPADPVFQDADTGYAAKIAQAKFFERGMKPSAVLSIKGNVDNAVRDEIMARVKALYGGLQNEEGMIVIGADSSLQILSDTKDMNWERLLRYTDEQASIAFGVPKIIFGLTDKSSRATARQERVVFTENTLVPMWEDIAGKLSRQLAPQFSNDDDERRNGELGFGFDLSGVPALQENKTEFADTMVRLADASLTVRQAGVMSREEVREHILRRGGLPLDKSKDDEAPPMVEGETEEEESTAKPNGAEAGKMRQAYIGAKERALVRVHKGAKTVDQVFPRRAEVRRLGRAFGRSLADSLVDAIREEFDAEVEITPEIIESKFEGWLQEAGR